MKAIWQGKTLAESNETIVVESNHYFPPDSIQTSLFESSELTSFCPWKGTAHYYAIKVDGQVNQDAAWYYPQPMEAAENIKDYIAFWSGVEVIES